MPVVWRIVHTLEFPAIAGTLVDFTGVAGGTTVDLAQINVLALPGTVKIHKVFLGLRYSAIWNSVKKGMGAQTLDAEVWVKNENAADPKPNRKAIDLSGLAPSRNGDILSSGLILGTTDLLGEGANDPVDPALPNAVYSVQMQKVKFARDPGGKTHIKMNDVTPYLRFVLMAPFNE